MAASRAGGGLSQRMPALSIRPARIRDASVIYELTTAMGYQNTLGELRSRLDEILANGDNEIFVASDDAALVGWVHVFVTRRLGVPGFAEIGGIVTLQRYRRRGIGQLLIEHCESWARGMNLSSLRARCNAQRREAHAFYENSAFVGSKSQTVFVKRL